MATPYDMAIDDYSRARLIAIIPRWSVVPVCRRQTNGEHIFLVARYVEVIYKNLGLHEFGPIGDFLLHALHHDDHEAMHGDLPTGSVLAVNKPKDEDTPELIRLVTRLADRMEAHHYTIEEQRLGNKFMNWEWNETGPRYQKARDALLECVTELRGNKRDSQE